MPSKFVFHFDVLCYCTHFNCAVGQFLPIIGSVVADLIEGKLAGPIVSKFAINRPKTGPDRSRQGQTRKLEIDQLCSAVDLAPARPS